MINYWRLAKVDINDGAMTSAVLWDSLSGSEAAIKQTAAFQNFTEIVEAHDIVPELRLAGIQHNGYSCMDYSIQEAYKDADIHNEITQAQNAGDLRFAVVKQIATNHTNMNELVEHLTMDESGVIEFGGNAGQQHAVSLSQDVKDNIDTFLEKFADPEQSATLTQEDINWQVTFDDVFAEHLQELYKANPEKQD